MAEKLRQPSEAQIQADFFTWLALHEKKYPELGLFYAIPNGANKSPAARGLFKRTGLKAGVPDVHLPLPMPRSMEMPWNRWNGLWIEFKANKGKASPMQIEWQTKLLCAGHNVNTCRSWTEAANVTIDYLNLPIKKFDEQQNGRRG